jgi:phytanoyl-CoA hydroxylase
MQNRTDQGFSLIDNTGSRITIPVHPSDDFAYFLIDDGDAIEAYYREHGYVVIRRLISPELLDAVNVAFNREVLPSRRFIYRQATANPERHVLSPHGFMLNAILNLQSLDPRFFGLFRNATEKILTATAMQHALTIVLGEQSKLVQSMYFHGNPVTWPHQDTYYQDSEHIGTMTAAWVAAEDIAPGAGRFFVYPGSHKIDICKHGGDFDIAYHHDRYKELVLTLIKKHNLTCRAPALAKGDVLFWNAKTIHGSLPTSHPECSRRSLTAHYIPESHQLLQFQSRIKPLSYDIVNGIQISRPKNQAIRRNRSILFVETRFPKLFQAAKKLAIKFVTSSWVAPPLSVVMSPTVL